MPLHSFTPPAPGLYNENTTPYLHFYNTTGLGFPIPNMVVEDTSHHNAPSLEETLQG